MDPFSLILSILGAAKTVSGGVQFLIKLGEISDLALALDNEISNLRLILSEISAIDPCLQLFIADGSERQSSLVLSLEEAQRTILELQQLIVYDVQRPDGTVDKIAWLANQKKLHKAQKALRRTRANINTSLNVLNTSVKDDAGECWHEY